MGWKTDLKNPKNVKFKDLLKVCTDFFGESPSLQDPVAWRSSDQYPERWKNGEVISG